MNQIFELFKNNWFMYATPKLIEKNFYYLFFKIANEVSATMWIKNEELDKFMNGYNKEFCGIWNYQLSETELQIIHKYHQHIIYE